MIAPRPASAGDLDVRIERVVRGRGAARILYASDLHLGWPWTRRVADSVIRAVRACAPDVLLLGGDLVDSRRALVELTRLTRVAAETTAVAAVPGNHDVALGAALVRDAVTAGGGTWLVDRRIAVGGVVVEGSIRRRDSAAPGGEPAVRVLCAHHPHVVVAAQRAQFDIVLAGHLHGGQVVLFRRAGRLYPYAWLDRWNGPRFEVGETTMLVSLGAGDMLPLRWRCPRELVLCEVS